ncbi:hypothetical protein BFP76_03650 [Amylibacter kogurei]|uniref:Uncharacterized protein n=1 Tax=Paramylibacter kogurei TaxID=1889778 RepID=A0A2G5K5M4_9RHOB|nr:DUF5333 domain-containing protein [Amylibacter kogurei]PIB24323.1 hypothetical protein BFP76_03650 [Amylibacter kogurei]
MRNILTTAAAISVIITGVAVAKPSLWSYDKISQGLFDMAVANEIGKRCSSISTRKIKGLSFAQSLFSYAKTKGYSYSEVKAFIEDDKEKAKLRARVVPYLKSEGVNINSPETFCPLGQREIKKNSQIGVLLKG